MHLEESLILHIYLCCKYGSEYSSFKMKFWQIGFLVFEFVLQIYLCVEWVALFFATRQHTVCYILSLYQIITLSSFFIREGVKFWRPFRLISIIYILIIHKPWIYCVYYVIMFQIFHHSLIFTSFPSHLSEIKLFGNFACNSQWSYDCNAYHQ